MLSCEQPVGRTAATLRYTSISSQDSGFTSQDTLYPRPPSSLSVTQVSVFIAINCAIPTTFAQIIIYYDFFFWGSYLLFIFFLYVDRFRICPSIVETAAAAAPHAHHFQQHRYQTRQPRGRIYKRRFSSNEPLQRF